MQHPTTQTPPRSSTDQARAALWTGILGAAKHIGRREPRTNAKRPAVVAFKPGAGETPVYFIGAGLFEFRIAQLMRCEHPVYAIEIPWPSQWHDAAARNDVDASPTLQELVAPYVAALRDHAGSSPCVIMGYSFHGSMAFEAAHQLAALGSKVAMVMLLDAPAQYPAPHHVARQKLREVWARSPQRVSSGRRPPSIVARLAGSGAILQWTLFWTWSNLKGQFLHWVLRDAGKLTTKLDALGRPMHWRLVERVYANSLRAYGLRPLDCRGAIFRADRAEDCPGGVVDYSLGWSGLFGDGLEIVQVTGDHMSMMRESPHDRNLADEICDLLERFCHEPKQHEPRAAAGAAAAER